MVGDYVVAMRPKHWLKNLFVAAPVVFAHRLFDPVGASAAALATAAFCLAASAVYLVNDVADLDQDRRHPVKRLRPLPAGRVSARGHLALALVLVALALAVASLTAPLAAGVVAVYAVLNLAYSLWLKHAVILDVMIVALGFVLRVEAGSAAIGATPSGWLLMCTFLLALFLGFGKRRHELVILEEGANGHRAVLEHYSPYFLDQMIAVVTASTVMSYALYTISPATVQKYGSESLLATTPFVLYGIFRYLYLVHQREEGGDPGRLLMVDRPLMGNVVLWAAAVVAVIYW